MPESQSSHLIVMPSAFRSIPIDHIRPSPHQARKDFNEESIKGLAESMKQEGLMQPITVRLAPGPEGSGSFELIAGERRLRAARFLGWAAIDVRIIDVPSEAAAAAKGLVENLQRVDLNPIEEAEGFLEIQMLDPVYWTQAKIASIAGKSQGEISRTLRFLEFSDQIKENMRRRIITEGHAVELLRLPTDALKRQIATKIEAGASVMEARQLVDRLLKHIPGKKLKQPTTDPMSATWPRLYTSPAIGASGAWQVTFRKGIWNFAVHSSAFQSPEELSRWFKQMSDALSAGRS